MRFRISTLAFLVLASPLICPQAATLAQQQGAAPSLRVQSQLVVEDVTVIDSHGDPVSGIPVTAFHVLDDGKPQQIRDFQQPAEATGREAASIPSPPTTAPGTFSNRDLQQNRGTIAVLLIDPSTMQLQDQLYLRLQAQRFVEGASNDVAIAVFRVNRSGVPVLLQPVTHDKKEILAAIAAAVPTLSARAYSGLGNAIVTLSNISDYLRSVPGRKAVIWLAGAFPLYQQPDFGGLCDVGQGSVCGSRPTGPRLEGQRNAFQALQEARIAVYPVDVRGVQIGGLTSVRIADSGPNSTGDKNIGAKPTSETERVTGQYAEMDRLAEATGGRAFYSNNHVASMIDRALLSTTDGYTLSYRPGDAAADGKWHRVRIQVDGPYTVRYRTGYFAADSAAPKQNPARKVLSAGGQALPVDRQEADTPVSASSSSVGSNRPIIFTAQVVAHPVAGKQSVTVRYVVPTNQLTFRGDPAGEARFQLAALAYDANGEVLSQAIDIVNTHYSAEQMHLADRIGTPADQTVQIAKGANYLLLAIEDLHTQRVGVVQLSLKQVPTAP